MHGACDVLAAARCLAPANDGRPCEVGEAAGEGMWLDEVRGLGHDVGGGGASTGGGARGGGAKRAGKRGPRPDLGLGLEGRARLRAPRPIGAPLQLARHHSPHATGGRGRRGGPRRARAQSW